MSQQHLRRERGQSIVEFGIVAILFTLLMFAVVDFGLLLNGWLTVSADAQKLARDAAVGNTPANLITIAQAYGIPGVTADAGYFTGTLPNTSYCCGPQSALILTVTYYDQCTPDSGSSGACPTVSTTDLDDRYGGACNHATHDPTASPPQPPCLHPARPSPSSVSPITTCPNPPHTASCPGDTVVIRLTAAGARVITPLVRPFFHCSEGGAAPCFVPMSSTVAMRFDGSSLSQ